MTHVKPLGLILAAALAGCNSPVPNMSFVAPDQRHWVAMESVAPSQEKDELLPTLRLRLEGRFGGGPLLLEGLETLCGTHLLWQDSTRLLVRIGADRARALRVHEGDLWKGISVHVQVHEEQVKMERWSPDGLRRLVVIAECESENWNLYLRRVGEPTYNEAMQSGWDDPDLFGGFEAAQAPVSLKWTGPRSAEIELPGKPYGVSTRDKIGDVTVKWSFVKKLARPKNSFKTIEPAH